MDRSGDRGMRVIRMATGAAAAALLLSGLAACGADDTTSAASREEARALGAKFQQAVAQGAAKEIAALCVAPVKFRGRVWSTPEEIERNFAGVIAILRDEIGAADLIEEFSVHQLTQGKWPRSEAVAESERGNRMSQLGLASGGFLVRIAKEPRKGLLLVLGLEGGLRLVIRGVV